MSKKECLSEQVQKTIDSTWGTEPWKPSKGYTIREKARSMLLEAFLKQKSGIVESERSEILVWAMEQR
jgi:hypothetical protein